MPGNKFQRSFEIFTRNSDAQSLRKRRFRIGNIVEKYAAQSIPRTENASHAERTGSVPQHSSYEIQRAAPVANTIYSRRGKCWHDQVSS